MAGRPSKTSKFSKVEETPAQAERGVEMGELDAEMALGYYPDDEQKRSDFLDFLRALRPGTPNPKSNTRAVHVYFYDEALKALYEGWRELVANRQIKSGDSMSRVVGMMVIEYARLSRLEKAAHWESMRERIQKAIPGPSSTDPTPVDKPEDEYDPG